MAVTESDFIIAIGTRFTDRSTGRLDRFAKNAKIAHIDIDPSSISKTVDIEIPVVGDCYNVLNMINKYLDDYKWEKCRQERDEWFETVKSGCTSRHVSEYFLLKNNCCHCLTIPKNLLLMITVFTPTLYCTHVVNSCIFINMPPSPDTQNTSLSGLPILAPIKAVAAVIF